MHRNDEITSVQSKPGKSPQYQTSEKNKAATTWLIMRAPMNIPATPITGAGLRDITSLDTTKTDQLGLKLKVHCILSGPLV